MGAKFKYDDRIQIIEPQFFLRCGYPQSFEGEKAIVEEQFGCEVSALLRRCGAYPNSPWVCARPSKAYDEIVRAITYGRLREKGFGGNKRELYTETFEDYRGTEASVINVNYVKTGTYAPGSFGYGDEYDPPGLLDQKTHRILTLSIYRNGNFLKIEDIHVKKL